jgi:hypothetical protein
MLGHGGLKRCAVCGSNIALAIPSNRSPRHRKTIALSPAHWCRDTIGVVGTLTLAKTMQTEAAVKLLEANLNGLVSTGTAAGNMVPLGSRARDRDKGTCTQQHIAFPEVRSHILLRV